MTLTTPIITHVWNTDSHAVFVLPYEDRLEIQSVTLLGEPRRETLRIETVKDAKLLRVALDAFIQGVEQRAAERLKKHDALGGSHIEATRRVREQNTADEDENIPL